MARTTSDDHSGSSEMIRSEEHLVVGTTHHPYARVRLRKVIVTREVTLSVQLRHEEFRLDHLPVVEDHDGEPALNSMIAQDGPIHEFVLHEEVPVVEVHVRPVQRVRVERVRRTGQAEVSAPLRKERVDVIDIEPDLPPAPGSPTTT